MNIGQITIVGTGLIGGSLGLALKKHDFAGRIVGCDRPRVLAQASRLSAIDVGIADLQQAVYGSNVVVLATPVGAVVDLIERIGPIIHERVLLTDVGSTKQEVVERARAVFGSAAAGRFLAGHPMAGKAHGGIEEADADLFQDAVWLVTPSPGQKIKQSGDRAIGASGHDCAQNGDAGQDAGPQMIDAWLGWVEKIGARVVVIDAERHDRLCAWVSHLPQMIATALAASLEEEFGADPELKAIGGRALREMTRIAASPYSMWRDIAFTNTGNIEEALQRMEQRLSHIRENLRTRGLQDEFERANQFRTR